MEQKKKLAVTALLLAAVLVFAAFAYQRLKESREPAGPFAKAGDGIVSEQTEPERTAEETKERQAETAAAKQDEDSTGETEPQRLEAVDFTVYDADGNAVLLSSMEGKLTVVNFWATWCGFCVREMPDFQKIYDEYGDQIHMMMINATDGQRETKEAAMAYVEDQGYTFPVYYDTDYSASYTYGVNALPTTLLISADGYVIAYANGAVSYEALKQALDDRLETAEEETAAE